MLRECQPAARSECVGDENCGARSECVRPPNDTCPDHCHARSGASRSLAGYRDCAGLADAARSRIRDISGVRASFWPAPTARTDDESTAEREKSIWSAARSLASNSSWRRSHTPALCQSRSRRQQVAPEPKPSWVGRWFHRMSVLSTNRMLFNVARFGTGNRPGFFVRRGFGGGSNGSMSIHNSLSTIGACIPHDSVAQMLEVNRSPVKLTAPRESF